MAALPIVTAGTTTHRRRSSASTTSSPRRTSQHSIFAKSVLMSKLTLPGPQHAHPLSNGEPPRPVSAQPAIPSAPDPPADSTNAPFAKDPALHHAELKPLPLVGANHAHNHVHRQAIGKDGVGAALSDTPAPSQPGSPRMCVFSAPMHHSSIGLTSADTP